MRFVSKYSDYSICYQRDITEHFATGESREIQPLLNCQFKSNFNLEPWELEAATASFVNRGTNVERDFVTPTSLAARYSIFDTVQFQYDHDMTDEKREDMELFLLNEKPRQPAHAFGTDYIMVEAPKVPAPWPTYDDFKGVKGMPTADRIAARVVEDGYDVQQVLLYERLNQNRANVIEALETIGLEAVEAIDPELVVNA